MRFVSSSALVLTLTIVGCADPEQAALLGTKDFITTELTAMHQAVLDIQSAAPAPDADGWNATDDAGAVDDMRGAWKRARVSYEKIEGAIAVLFPNLDASTDERYDGFLSEAPDLDLFDDQGVIGVHAIERIVFADVIPENVVAFESPLDGYAVAAFPTSSAQAEGFKNALVQRLVDDTQRMIDEFVPLALDTSTAYRGVIGSMAEQVEKLALAGSGEDESRYAQTTLLDMRANLDGGRAIFEQFAPMFTAAGSEGEDARQQILARLDAVKARYATIDGDAIPTIPEGWNPDAPTEAHLATPYGELFVFLTTESNVDDSESLVSLMGRGGDLLGIPALPE